MRKFDNKLLWPYEYLWTTELDDHLLFTIECYGNTEYLIFHKPTKQVLIIPGGILGNLIIDQMIASGVEVCDAPYCAKEAVAVAAAV